MQAAKQRVAPEREETDMGFRRPLLLLVLIFAMFNVPDARAQDGGDFYRGKTIEMIIGGSPGVSYDLIGRALAQHMPRHLPGNPNFVVENMPGAGSLIMTNFLYNKARRDGTVIGMPNTNVIFEPTLKLMSNKGGAVQFDLEKFIWLGTPVQEPQVMMVWKGAGPQNLQDMTRQRVVFGSSGAGTDNQILPQLVNRIWGTKNEMVMGYKSPADIFLAMERGEVQGVSAALSTLMVNRSQWIRDGKVNLLMQFGLERALELPDLPTAIEQAPNPEDAAVLRFIGAKFALARPLVLPPETPPERAQSLRAAYEATLRDPAFQADMKKLGISLKPIDGTTMTRMIKEIQSTPADRVKRLRAMINP
jgi:tripartite-type tricarboxylate transporter receptor subunit TctC